MRDAVNLACSLAWMSSYVVVTKYGHDGPGREMRVELLSPNWFRALLDERGYTPASFARAVGVTPATVHRLLAGTRRASPGLANRIAIALDHNLTALFRVAAR